MAQKYFRGQGRLFVRAATGSNDSLRWVGNVSDLMINTTQNKQDHQESYTGERRTDLRMVTTTQVTFSATLENTIKENWQLAFKGSAASQAGATITNESHTAPAVGGFFALSKKYISAMTSITSDPAGTTYTAGTDYITALPSNIIEIPSGSTMAGDAILCNYTCGTADVVGAFNATSADQYFYFDGLNTVDSNKPVVIEIFKVDLDPAQQISLISDNLTQFQMQGTVLYDVTNDQVGADFGGFFKVTQTA